MEDFVNPPSDLTGLHGPSPILLPDGTPARKSVPPSQRKKLSDEVAAPQLAGTRLLWDQSIASGLNPERLASLLKGAIRGDHRLYLELAEEMEERDAHYLSVLGTRKRALSQIRPSVEPPKKGSEARIVEAVEALVEDPSFPDLVEDLLDALGKGYSAVEILWGEGAEPWKTPVYVWRDPKYFTFDYVSRSELRLARLGTIDGDPLDPWKFIVHYPKSKAGIPIRGGFARLSAWSFLLKSFSLKDWASFLDVFGMPIRLGKYHPSATADDRRKLLQAVTQIASDAAAIIPESMVIELLEAKTGGPGTVTPFEGLCRFLDEQMSKLILGQTMTVENGGSLAQAQVHNQIRIDILQADARQLAATLNAQLIEPFVRFNFGDEAALPRVIFPVAEPQDVAALSNALSLTVPLGLKVKADEVREKLGLTKPDAGDEVLEAPKAPDAPKAKPPGDGALASAAANLERLFAAGCPACGETKTRLARNLDQPPTDALDRLGEEESADWQEALGPTVADVLAAAAGAKSYEEFQAALNALYADLDTSALQKRLAITGAIGRGYGLAKGPRDG